MFLQWVCSFFQTGLSADNESKGLQFNQVVLLELDKAGTFILFEIQKKTTRKIAEKSH